MVHFGGRKLVVHQGIFQVMLKPKLERFSSDSARIALNFINHDLECIELFSGGLGQRFMG